MNLFQQIAFIAAVLPLGSFANPNSLWYSKPAGYFSNALPIGNGRLGAMIWGGVTTDKITLNEDTIWSGGFIDRVNNGSLEALPLVREYMDTNQYSKANSAYSAGLVANPTGQRMYQTPGQINITMDHAWANVAFYNRSLNLGNGVASTVYRDTQNNWHSREAVANYPTGVLAFRFWSSPLTMNVTLYRSEAIDSHTTRGNTSVLTGHGTDDTSFKFASALRVKVEGGSLTVVQNTFVIKDATSVELYYDAETLFRHPDGSYEDVVHEKVDAAYSKGFATLKREAISDYQPIYRRATLSLPGAYSSALARNSTDVRVAAIKSELLSGASTPFQSDPSLLLLAYNYGRYLLIASSRPGTLPANLQGIWNDRLKPSWDSKFTININTEMNYWLGEENQLPDIMEPLWDHALRMRGRGEDVARKMYGCGGWVCHHNSDIHGDCAPQDPYLKATAWPSGALWLSSMALDHFRFTRNTTFARNVALPLAKGAIEFAYDFAVDNGNHWLWYPSSSPELQYTAPGGSSTGLARDTQMNRALLWDLFTSFIEVSNAVGSTDGVSQATTFLARVGAPTMSRSTGRLYEWDGDYVEQDPGHRHFSSLYGLYPGRQYSASHGNKTIFNAAMALVDYRLKNGGGSTGWSRVWTGLLHTRALQGNVALQDARVLLANYTSPALFSNAGALQMDGTYGITALVNAYFLQSHAGFVHIGPAIPSVSVATGSFSGWVARGSFVVDAAWSNGNITSATVVSRSGLRLALRVENGRRFLVNGTVYSGPISTTSGQTYKITF